MKRKLSVNRLILSLVITILVFIIALLASYSVSYSEYQKISQKQTETLYRILSFEVISSSTNFSCDSFEAGILASGMDYMGSIINLLEKRFGKNDVRVLEQKKLYSVLEAEHFIYTKDFNKNCNSNITTILFFYSNENEFSFSADRIGSILSTLKSNRGGRIMVYSFDYNLNEDAVNAFKKIYNVTNPNTLVINEKEKIVNLQDLAKIEEFLS